MYKRQKIVSPEFNHEFKSFLKRESEQYIFKKRKFRNKDLLGCFLVFAATNNSELNQRITFLAREKNILVNTVDNAEISDFTLPAIVNRGELLLTVSTGSSLPALSKNILDIMSENRAKIIENIEDDKLRKNIWLFDKCCEI